MKNKASNSCYRSLLFIPFLLFALILLNGCSVESGVNVFDSAIDSTLNVIDEEQEIIPLEEAIANTQSDMAEKFWFRAHIANNIEKRRTTFMTVNGIVVRPHGYYMHNTLVTQPFEYYRWDDNIYVRQNENWFRGREASLPFDIFYGFEHWEPYLQRATLLGEDEVLSVPTFVYQIELTGEEMLNMDVPMFAHLEEEIETIKPLLDETKVRVLFYVGQAGKSTDTREILPIIYKYQTWIQMPIPGAGHMEQEVQHFIFRVNEDNVEMNSLEQMERYVIEIDEVLEMMEEELKKEEEQYR